MVKEVEKLDKEIWQRSLALVGECRATIMLHGLVGVSHGFRGDGGRCPSIEDTIPWITFSSAHELLVGG